MSRKTEFWKSSTPDKLGPGYYSQAAQKVKQNKTGFLIKEKRPLSYPKYSVKFTPGPGSYLLADEWSVSSNQETSIFASKTKRDLFNLSSCSYNKTPGPGSYESKALSKNSSKKKPKFSTVILDPSPVSIPSRDPQILETSISETSKQSDKGTSFGKYKSNRKVFIPQSKSPGPGTYNLLEKQANNAT